MAKKKARPVHKSNGKHSTQGDGHTGKSLFDLLVRMSRDEQSEFIANCIDDPGENAVKHAIHAGIKAIKEARIEMAAKTARFYEETYRPDIEEARKARERSRKGKKLKKSIGWHSRALEIRNTPDEKGRLPSALRIEKIYGKELSDLAGHEVNAGAIQKVIDRATK